MLRYGSVILLFFSVGLYSVGWIRLLYHCNRVPAFKCIGVVSYGVLDHVSPLPEFAHVHLFVNFYVCLCVNPHDKAYGLAD